MNKLIKILSNPAARCGIGLLVTVLGGGLAGALFPPLGVIILPFIFLTLMLGEDAAEFWYDSDTKEQCAVCGEETGVKLIRVRHYMYAFVPLPIINALCRALRIPYRSTYYKVCAKCKETHVEENDLAMIQTIANGGLATVCEITKQEFETMIKK